MSVVATPIVTSVVTSVALRPIRSPRWPKTTPPMGRARNPTANVANAASVPVSDETFGKNCGANTVTAARP